MGWLDLSFFSNAKRDNLSNEIEEIVKKGVNYHRDEQEIEWKVKKVISSAVTKPPRSPSKKSFDVFLAHNSRDKPTIRRIAGVLRERGIEPWLDEEQIVAGDFFIDAIQKAIVRVSTAAIFIGSDELGKWQQLELRAFINALVESDVRVIPVLLPGGKIPDSFTVLSCLHWVDLSEEDLSEYIHESIEPLIEGIKRGRP